MLCCLTLSHHIFCLWFHARNLLYITSPQKQETDVSLILKDSDRESENLSSLIWLSVTDSQITDSSKDVSFIGIQSKLFITSLVITEYSISDLNLLGMDPFPL